MLDIRLIRENPSIIEEDLRKRGDSEKIPWVNELLDLDSKWRRILVESNGLKEKRNKITREVEDLHRRGLDASDRIREAASVPKLIADLEKEAGRYRERIDYILLRLPNIMDSTVPVGRDDNDNVEVRRWGKIASLDFIPKDHIDLCESLDLIDTARAAKVAGSRFYYLLDGLVQLNYALIKYALDFIQAKGLRLVQPPYLIKREAIGGAIALSDFEEMIYKVEGEDLYLIATAEHALLSMHMGEILDGNTLPLRYAGISPCFRKEAGAHGRDTKGIFRVHQFEKVEQFVFCRPEDSSNEHEALINRAEEFFQSLQIPYRVVNVCSGDLGTVASKKYDLEGWLPGQGKFRELVSCSNCSAYQAMRSKIRFRNKTNEPTAHVHTLNSTLVASERALIAIIENYQKPDGSIAIPPVLIPYMGGLREIA
ncbi:serine--tRNA ligase [Candidatus Bathyarchaeota archaeon]|nr:serine--tRNA ligase [Candidatus Bathyarchaeota archaeon]